MQLPRLQRRKRESILERALPATAIASYEILLGFQMSECFELLLKYNI